VHAAARRAPALHGRWHRAYPLTLTLALLRPAQGAAGQLCRRQHERRVPGLHRRAGRQPRPARGRGALPRAAGQLHDAPDAPARAARAAAGRRPHAHLPHAVRLLGRPHARAPAPWRPAGAAAPPRRAHPGLLCRLPRIVSRATRRLPVTRLGLFAPWVARRQPSQAILLVQRHCARGCPQQSNACKLGSCTLPDRGCTWSRRARPSAQGATRARTAACLLVMGTATHRVAHTAARP
jgi:hypothetical protein